MRSFFITILLFAAFFQSKAQSEETDLQSSEPSFTETVDLDLKQLKSVEADSIFTVFKNHWNQGSKLSSQNKTVIEKVYNKMKKDNLSVSAIRFPFLHSVSGAASNIQNSSQAINSFLDVTSRAIDELDNKSLISLLRSTETIFAIKALYYSPHYQVAFKSGTPLFEWDKEPEVSMEPEKQVVEAEETVSEWGSDEDDAWDQSENAWGTDENWTEENKTEKETDAPATIDLTAFSEPMPLLAGPVVSFSDIDLEFLTNSDTIIITNVSGRLELIGNTFVAEKGLLTWEHLGKDPKELNVELSEFTFEVNAKTFSAEQVTLNLPSVLDQPVKGLLDFGVENKNSEAPQYPFFQSYKSGYNLNFIEKEGIYLKGGISVKGTDLSTEAMDKSNSSLEVHDSAAKKFRAESRDFHYSDSTFSSDQTIVTIYQSKDSIYHPGLNLRYELKNNSLTLLKDKGSFKNTPFYASYFNTDFTADKINWEMDSSVIDISILLASNRVPALFESAEYFNEYRYNSLSGLYKFHALQMVVNYSRETKQLVFYTNELAEKTGIEEGKIMSGMKLLLQNGFIKYDLISGKIELLDKAFHYVDARWGKKDYDNLQISSVSAGKANGKLNLSKGTLEIIGVEDFNINDKLGIRVIPDSGKVVLRKNREILFDGIVYAGNYQYKGSDFRMDYDSFLISMEKIENIKFNLAKGDKSKQSDKEKVQNQLVETAGILYINDPNNKSARKEYPRYPIFDATKGSSVYFGGNEVLGGVYDKSLTFEIPPFQIDSVSSSDPNSISFDGTFKSGNIFPEFQEKLRVMPDKSLGFSHALPEEGIELLGGDAQFYGSIKLDNKGLRGGDRIEYLSSVVKSEDFTFYNDSILAQGISATIEPSELDGISYPKLEATDFEMRWLTTIDSLHMTNKSDPFKMYDQTASLDGKATLSKKGLFGKGELETRGSLTSSEDYVFKEQSFAARHADFKIESTDSLPALSADDVRLDFDFMSNTATINPEVEGDAALEFPFAKYKTSIPSALWKLDEKIVEMNKPEDVDINNSYFYSTDSIQDSLVFNATKAIYDIESQVFNVSGIPYITVADARITPKDGEVVIGQNGQIEKLYSASLQIDTLQGYHNLYDAEIEIISRKKFIGNATYRYVNSVGDSFSIKMGEFSLEPLPDVGRKKNRLRTVSSGSVTKEDRMLISPGMYYKGDVTMYADRPALLLKGYIQPDLRDIPNYDTWINYTTDGRAKEVVIDFDHATTELGEPLQAGIHFDGQNTQLYATFINEKRDLNDQNFFTPDGLLTYNQEKKQFIIESKDKKEGVSYAGKYFAYNETNQKIEFEGPFSFLENRKKAEFKAAGSGSGDLQSQEFSFNLMMTCDFDLPNAFTKIAGEDIVNVVQRLGLPESTKDLARLLPKIAEIASNSSAKRYEENILDEYIPLHSLSTDLTQTVVLNNIDFKWSEKEHAWYSVGKIGLSNIGKHDINANVDGFVEIQKLEIGSAIKMFLQVSPSCWYFFHYEEGRLIFFSSNKKANALIKKKSKAAKAKVGDFVFLSGDKLEVTNFAEGYRKKYFDIDAPYYIEMASEATDLGVSSDNQAVPIQETTPEEDDDDGF